MIVTNGPDEIPFIGGCAESDARYFEIERQAFALADELSPDQKQRLIKHLEASLGL